MATNARLARPDDALAIVRGCSEIPEKSSDRDDADGPIQA
jgi:hypothetical protein